METARYGDDATSDMELMLNGNQPARGDLRQICGQLATVLGGLSTGCADPRKES